MREAWWGSACSSAQEVLVYDFHSQLEVVVVGLAQVDQPPSLVCCHMSNTCLSLFEEGYRLGGTTRYDRFETGKKRHRAPRTPSPHGTAAMVMRRRRGRPSGRAKQLRGGWCPAAGMTAQCRDPSDNGRLLEEWARHPDKDEWWDEEDTSLHFAAMVRDRDDCDRAARIPAMSICGLDPQMMVLDPQLARATGSCHWRAPLSSIRMCRASPREVGMTTCPWARSAVGQTVMSLTSPAPPLLKHLLEAEGAAEWQPSGRRLLV